MQSVTAEQAHQWLEKDEAILIDIRPQSMRETRRIEKSRHLTMREVMAGHLPKTDKKIIIQCRSGMSSAKVCKRLDKDNIYNLTGGIKAWRQAGLPVLGEGGLSFERQIQLTIGLSVLAFSVLGYFVHPAFMFGAAFFGAGLINAGLTGWCGLGLLIAKMPWNRVCADRKSETHTDLKIKS